MPAELVLRHLQPGDEAEALCAHRDLSADGTNLLTAWESGLAWDAYLERLDALAHGEGLPAEWVPFSLLVGVVGTTIVGGTSVRHELNDALAEEGGHIGYAVRPGYRCHGYATEMLRQALRYVGGLGIGHVLVTCSDDNIASVRVIEHCGGRLAKVLAATADRPAKRHYWFDAQR